MLVNRVNELITKPTQPSSAQEMVKKYKDVLTSLGFIKSNAKIHIDKTVTLCKLPALLTLPEILSTLSEHHWDPT